MDALLLGKLLLPGLPEKSSEAAADQNLHLHRVLEISMLVVTLCVLGQLRIGSEILQTSSNLVKAVIVAPVVVAAARKRIMSLNPLLEDHVIKHPASFWSLVTNKHFLRCCVIKGQG